MSFSSQDKKFMQQALKLALRAEGIASPDPLVGAVLVKNGKVVSTGFHSKLATPHAESWAIKKAGKKAKGSTLYINLEPCCHFGNNPPCTTNIINAGVKKVIAAMQDPNPLVNGKGFKILQDAGIIVKRGLFEKEAKKQNEAFIKHITTKLPFVVLKVAMTKDEKITTNNKWITGKKARKYVHHLRNIYDSILVGVNTVIADNPGLTVRMVNKVKNPIRIVLDSYGRTPLSSKVLNTNMAPTIIIVSKDCSKAKIRDFTKKGAEVLVLPARRGKINLKKLMEALGKRRIISVLIEGGSELNASLIKAKITDKVLLFISPKKSGTNNAKPFLAEGKRSSLRLKKRKFQKIGNDQLVEGYLK